MTISITGEIIQRINDHRKVESYFSTGTISIVLSFLSLIVFGIVLFVYSSLIFLIFFVGTILYILWIFLLLKRRKIIDYELFNQSSINSELMYEFVYGMQEIKLQNSEVKRSLQWTNSQIDLLRINLKAARLNQIQDGGAFFINQIKDIIITIIAASLVINGVFSLGTVLAIQLILGLLNAPVQQLVTFIRTSFDVKLCLKRILEVHNKEEENISDSANGNDAIGSQDLIVRNVSFKYNFLYDFVLKDISFTIPKGKITAIVGSSGSGKTTLIKLLLGFYKPTEGNILLGNRDMPQIPIDRWRKECGVVLQDGYIFSDTIANNISESDESVDIQKLEKASEIANLNEFVEGLTLGFQTMIGSKGTGLSQGQKQRILIARAVYKDPSYLFFDEATNALDTQNEKEIIGKLNNFYKEKSVVVVAHRLSTVRNADQIIVLSKGEISEIGTHNELIAKKSVYYNLIRNQLELEQS